MALKGAEAKETITKKILETFPGSFVNGKEIRICMAESGEVMQIKVTLTTAKDLVDAPTASTQIDTEPVCAYSEPTAEDKDEIKRLLEKLGL